MGRASLAEVGLSLPTPTPSQEEDIKDRSRAIKRGRVLEGSHPGLINWAGVGVETHPFVRDTASHFPQKLRCQLLLEGRALKQSADGCSERRGGNRGDDWSHSDMETVPPLHPDRVRPRHLAGGRGGSFDLV